MWVSGIPGTLPGVAHVANGLSFLRRHRRGKVDIRPSDAIRVVVLAFSCCVLVHAADALGVYRPTGPVFTAVPALAAFAALTAVTGLPGPFQRMTSGRGAVGRVGVSRDPATDRASAGRDLARYERLRDRVLILEDTFRRHAWIHERRLAMKQLDELLAGRDPRTGDPPTGSRRGEGPEAGAGGEGSDD